MHSVTEREVINGVLKAKHPNDHCVCYVRHINNINMNQLRSAARFVDIAQNQVNCDQRLLINRNANTSKVQVLISKVSGQRKCRGINDLSVASLS